MRTDARENYICRYSIREGESQHPWQPTVRSFEYYKDYEPDTKDAQPHDEQALE